jgi:hypothetical protein
MSDDKSGSIDPRFDPAFQRGFDGAVTTTRRRPTAGTPSVVPAQQSVARPPAPEYPAQTAATPPTPAPATVDDMLEPVEVEESPGGVNPFIVSLWIVAALLVIGGGYLVQWARSTFLTQSLSTDIDYVTIEIVKYGAPLLVFLGLATALGLVFLYAARWQRRRG